MVHTTRVIKTIMQPAECTVSITWRLPLLGSFVVKQREFKNHFFGAKVAKIKIKMVRPKEMDEILRQIGWADGFNIPAISDENRELENEVSKMLREKATLLASVAELDELLSSITSHTKELTAECAQNESLLTEQQSQLDSEASLIKLLQGEEARLKNAIQQEKHTRRVIEERCARIESQLRTREARARGAERDAESGQLVRGEWEKEEERANLAAKTLADFYKQDETKLKELELQRVRLQSEVLARTQELLEAAGTVGALEQQLDASARQYRGGLVERRALVARWEASAAGVRAREQASRHLEQEIAELRASLRDKEERLNEARDFEEDQARNNRELETRSRGLGHQLMRLKDALKSQKQYRDALHEEVGTLQCQLAGCGSELSAERSRATELAVLVKDREAERQQLQKACADRRARLAMLNELQGGAGERGSKLLAIQQEKGRELSDLRKRGEKLDLEATRARREVVRLREAEKAAAAGVSAQHAALRNVASQRAAVEKELDRHRDMLLCLELSVHRQQLRISRLNADKPSEQEDPKLIEREEKLKITLQDKLTTRDLLSRELKNTEKSERQVDAACAAATAQLQELQESERALQATVDGGAHREDEAEARENQARARLALLQARVSRRQEETSQERNAVLQLRTAALQMEHAGKLQSGEMGVETSAMKAEIAGAEQENAELRAAIAQRKLRLQQLQNVFDITVTTMERDDGLVVQGSDLSQCATEYITRQRIRVALEKGELVQRGNSLDDEIRRAEREIRAMEHTLALVKAANDRYRCNLALPGAAMVAQAGDPELHSLIEVEEQRQQELRAELRRIRDTETRMRETSHRLRVELAAAAEEQRTLSAKYAEREHEIAETQREIAEQQVKLRRASNQARRLSRDLRSGNPAQATFEERDIEVREMRRVTNAALRELWSLAEQHVEVRPLVARYLQEKGLPCAVPAPEPQQRRAISSSRRTPSRQSAASEQPPITSPALLNIHFAEELTSPTGSQKSQQSHKTP